MKPINIIILISLILLSACHIKKYDHEAGINKPDAREILLLGSFHYNNPGADVVKSKVFDVMTDNGQKQLEALSNKILKYNPSKIFVEWDVEDQENLDKLYQKYIDGIYFDDKSMSDFYVKNEIFQLGFRIAKKLKHKKVYAIDYMHTTFDYPTVLQAMSEHKQGGLKKELDEMIKNIGTETDKMMSNMTLEELYLHLNQLSEASRNIGFYTEFMVRAGDLKNSAGVELVSEWYKRNLFMWSHIQKQVTKEDKKIMVLLGAGHTAILDQIISRNHNWKIADLRKVFNGIYFEVEF